MTKKIFINKQAIIRYWKQLLSDRLLLALSVSLFTLCLILAIILAIKIDASELSLITRYSAYGVTHFYRGHWAYLVTFIVFESLVALIHPILAIKLLTKDRAFAIGFVLIGFLIATLGFIYGLKVIGVQTIITG